MASSGSTLAGTSGSTILFTRHPKPYITQFEIYDHGSDPYTIHLKGSYFLNKDNIHNIHNCSEDIHLKAYTYNIEGTTIKGTQEEIKSIPLSPSNSNFKINVDIKGTSKGEELLGKEYTLDYLLKGTYTYNH